MLMKTCDRCGLEFNAYEDGLVEDVSMVPGIRYEEHCLCQTCFDKGMDEMAEYELLHGRSC